MEMLFTDSLEVPKGSRTDPHSLTCAIEADQAFIVYTLGRPMLK